MSIEIAGASKRTKAKNPTTNKHNFLHGRVPDQQENQRSLTKSSDAWELDSVIKLATVNDASFIDISKWENWWGLAMKLLAVLQF